MDHTEAARLWEQNAELWTRLARAGYDTYRNAVNSPAFFAMLPEVTALDGLDIGCGEGYNTRLAAARGARMTAIDISPTFIRQAVEEEEAQPRGIAYRVADALELPFADASFDFAIATMSLMDVPQPEIALREAYRVIKPGGFLQFSITHPCFDTPRLRSVRDERGYTVAKEVGDYFTAPDVAVQEWLFSAAPKELRDTLPKFRVPRFYRTLSWWLNAILDAGFALERVGEPCADEVTAKRVPSVADTRSVAYFLHLRCRKGSC